MRLIFPALLFLACGEEFSNEIFFDAPFIEAAPSARDLRLGQSGFGSFALSEKELAELYIITRSFTLNLDSLIFRQLREIDTILEGPPSERGLRVRRWGPQRSALDPLESRFLVERDEDRFLYRLEQHNILNGAEGIPIWGEFQREERVGQLHFDLEAARHLGSSEASGQVEVEYRFTQERVELRIYFEEFREDSEAPLLNSEYLHIRDPKGGRFEFAFPSEEGEWIQIKSRWLRDGSGRAEAKISSDAGSWVLSECWDQAFISSYRALNPPIEPQTGEEHRCVLDAEPFD